MKKLVLSVFLLVTLFAAFTFGASDRTRLRRHKRYIEWGPDVAGPYCETRRGGCCPGRDDYCSVPILGSLCYCDAFCNRTRGDCCPDFFSFCLGYRTTTPAPLRGACQHENRPYPPNAKVRINCQDCTCAADPLRPGKYAFRCDGEVCLIREDIINGVNGGNFGWRASNYSNMWGLTLSEGVRYKLGTYKPSSLVRNMNPIRVTNYGRLPESFDARVEWPGRIREVRDQGNCGASWAFSTTALAADRLSIESRGALADSLSAQQLLSCNRHGQGGCDGGYLDRAWWFVRRHGVVAEDCYPYTSDNEEGRGRCLLNHRQRGGRCPSGIPFRKERVFQATPPYRIAMSEEDIMSEISMNGPVQATFKVKEDFYMYRSGVYSHSRVATTSHTGDDKRLYHSIRIIGWGVDRQTGQKYWLCANSWGKDWGEQGYFRIARGQNECQIESFVLGVWGKVEGDEELRALITQFREERRFRLERLGRNNQN